MKVVIRTKYGSPDILTINQVERSDIKAKEVLIKVHATTVNRTDCGLLYAKPFILRFFTGLVHPRSHRMGTDFAGEVVAVGKKVSAFNVGDRVFGFDDTGLGSQAEYVAISTEKAIEQIPKKMSYEEAVASLEGVHYAYNFVNKIKLKGGDKVLINGATGAIGSALFQIVKTYDVQITAVCSTENLELIKSYGVDRVIDYMNQDFTEMDESYHYILDAVGKSSYFKCKSILEPKGIYMSSELGAKCQNLFLGAITPILGGKKVLFPFPSDIKGSIKFIKGLIEKNQFQPIIDRTYGIDEIVAAYRYVESGQKIGNVIIKY